MTPLENYRSLMQTIAGRFDVIGQLKASQTADFARSESAAFHGRKIVEGTAFACLVAIENGLTTVPRGAKGQWNAENIFNDLKKKGLEVLPSPSVIRPATPDEEKEHGVKTTIEGVPERRLTHDELIAIYKRLHDWAHELNPYTQAGHDTFCVKHSPALWNDLGRLERFLERHFISIRGKGFYCTVRDKCDGQTKVLPLQK